MTPREIFLGYLRRYAAKDLDGIASMFSEEVTLRDWNLSVKGREAAIAETRKNFESATSLQIEVLHVLENTNSVAGELRILVDGHIELFVVDVLDFDAEGRITAIRAFLERRDDA
ncbi:nuclear transport factor 2 family protein [Roseateles sp. L2-2]|uniref:nuclear transport factor 2 family protein n=1 Tax=Roseateles sp. L2-2 TaxID=3422597 RepID=UPI003D36F5AE